MVLFGLKFTNLSHIFPQKVKGMCSSQFYVSFSVETELKCSSGGSLTGAKSHTNKTDMLFRGAASWPHDAGCGKTVICTCLFPDPFRHLGSRFYTDRTELCNGIGINPQNINFHFIGIAHNPSQVIGTATRKHGNQVRNIAPPCSSPQWRVFFSFPVRPLR